MFLLAWLAGILAALAPFQDTRVAARGKDGVTITRSELETTLLERHGYSENGRELLDLFLRYRLLESLAAERNIKVKDAEVTKKLEELEQGFKATGQTLADEMRRTNLSPEQFREYMRLALVQERLTRAALGISERTKVTSDQQEIWIQQEINTRGQELLPPARGLGGALLRCGEITVTRAEFAEFLHERLSRETVKESAWHLLLAKAIEQRMPDLSPEARARAFEQELERRRAKHALEFPQITFEQRLAATGRSLDTLRTDPSVAIAALSRLWVDRGAGPEGVRAAYEGERQLFEARYGEALRASMLFLVAGRFVNKLVPRTFDEAEGELRKLAEKCPDQETFVTLVAKHSEEPGTKKQKGDLGFVTRGEARVPAGIREALFQVLDQGGTIPPKGLLVGPVRLDSGVALLWASERRPSPSWEEMSERVHEELRRRFLEDLMPTDSVVLVKEE
jgi:parvulin-like peptidyl-prolyl isomerase